MIDNTALKACPFCGNEKSPGYSLDFDKALGERICCDKTRGGCGASTGYYRYKKDAIDAWNRRAEPANEPLTLDELREMHGEPVWVATMQEWRIVLVVREDESVRLYSVYNSISAKSVIDNDGRIYRRKPEPEGGAR